MSDADFARLLADLTRMAARLAEIDARDLGLLPSASGAQHLPVSLVAGKE